MIFSTKTKINKIKQTGMGMLISRNKMECEITIEENDIKMHIVTSVVYEESQHGLLKKNVT